MHIDEVPGKVLETDNKQLNVEKLGILFCVQRREINIENENEEKISKIFFS